LIVNTIENKAPYYVYENIEKLRAGLLQSEKEINILDFGAGSTINKSNQRKVKDIAKNSAKIPKFGQLLFRLVNKFQPQVMIELGTSLGISTIYQAAANQNSKFITLEGCPETAQQAKENFEKLDVKNVEQVIGNFDTTLPKTLQGLNKLDYVFFDGNHRKDATLQYFYRCLPLINNDTLFVFDDIHWSDEMEIAWMQIKQHPDVILTVDLFFVGLVFFRKEQPKQHFTIRF
jgi:predicted O-methyltransferase YrrM